MTDSSTKASDKDRLLKLPEPHRTVLELSIDAMLRTDTTSSLTITKIKTEKGVTFSVSTRQK